MSSSILRWNTYCTDRRLIVIPESFQANVGAVLQNMPRPLPLTFFPVNYSSLI
jgi:hypothetical protein